MKAFVNQGLLAGALFMLIGCAKATHVPPAVTPDIDRRFTEAKFTINGRDSRDHSLSIRSGETFVVDGEVTIDRDLRDPVRGVDYLFAERESGRTGRKNVASGSFSYSPAAKPNTLHLKCESTVNLPAGVYELSFVAYRQTLLNEKSPPLWYFHCVTVEITNPTLAK